MRGFADDGFLNGTGESGEPCSKEISRLPNEHAAEWKSTGMEEQARRI